MEQPKSPIAQKCMVVNLQIGVWTGHRLDKDASRRVTEDAGAEADAARVNKHLVPKEMLKPIITASTAIRSHFYTKTLPWQDNGNRVLTKMLYVPFLEEHGRLVSTFKGAVQKFIGEDYPVVRDRAAFRMGEMFNANDYPSAYDIARRFYVHLDIDPVAEANDFRVELGQEHEDRVRADIEAATKKRISTAMEDVWARISETLGHYANKMADPKQVFRDSTVNNLMDVIELLPALNLVEDAALERIRVDLAKSLGNITPKELRENETVRFTAAAEAKRIMEEMQGFQNAWKGFADAA